jgi:hypothetical protein
MASRGRLPCPRLASCCAEGKRLTYRVPARGESLAGARKMPKFEEFLLVLYVVCALFGFYVVYMYDPVSVHLLFSRLFNPLI